MSKNAIEAAHEAVYGMQLDKGKAIAFIMRVASTNNANAREAFERAVKAKATA